MMVKQTPLDYESQRQAFRVLLKRCLNLLNEDDLLIIYDESLSDFFKALVSVIEEDHVSTTFVCVPKSYQSHLVQPEVPGVLRDRIPLPSGIVAAISNSTAIINLLDGKPENASLRRAVNHTGRIRICRLATIPGISSEILQIILRSPIDEILEDCERVAWMLGETHDLELISYDGEGRPYTLRMNLNGWEGEPIMSTGVLVPGSWGNVPPGETFCCPPYTTVNGEVCINGSVPGSVLGEGQEVVLLFERGKLVEWRAPVDPSSPGLAFFDREQGRAKRNEDPNWNSFAELGIGLNPEISWLTGNSLFDEKAKQSIHIAIGDNSAFGDDLVSFLHADLVTWRPDLRLDGQTVIVRGDIQTSLIDGLRVAPPRSEPVPPEMSVKLREALVERHNDVLKRRLSKAHRINFVTMADEATSRKLDRLCQLLISYETVDVRDLLEQNPAIDGVPTTQLLGILNHYRVLHVTPSARD
jgi:leucyl aminopeptidase (aminopeptidase T)